MRILKPLRGYVLPTSVSERCTTIWSTYFRKGDKPVIMLPLTKEGRLTKRSRDFLAEHFPEGD